MPKDDVWKAWIMNVELHSIGMTYLSQWRVSVMASQIIGETVNLTIYSGNKKNKTPHNRFFIMGEPFGIRSIPLI